MVSLFPHDLALSHGHHSPFSIKACWGCQESRAALTFWYMNDRSNATHRCLVPVEGLDSSRKEGCHDERPVETRSFWPARGFWSGERWLSFRSSSTVVPYFLLILVRVSPF